MAEYHSISDLVKLSIDNNQEIWQVVLTGQAHDKMMSERDVFAQMKQMYRAMKSADELYDWQLNRQVEWQAATDTECVSIMSRAIISVEIS